MIVPYAILYVKNDCFAREFFVSCLPIRHDGKTLCP